MWRVFTKAIERWRLFERFEPGHRFQTRYNNHRQRRERGETSRYGRFFNLGGGLALVVAGFAFLPTPGPSYILIVIGMWLMSGELLLLARLFDRLEVRLRSLLGWVKVRWSRLPAAVKVLVVSVCVAALGYGAYLLLLDN